MSSNTWIPDARTDLELLAWASSYLNISAIDTAPTTVGPGHNGGTSPEATVPGWVKSRAKEFHTAMAALRRLQMPVLGFPCGLVSRQSQCDYCGSYNPWEAYTGGSHAAFGTLAQVLWVAWGLHGTVFHETVIQSHVAWHFASDKYRLHWSKIQSPSIRATAMQAFGKRILQASVSLYNNLTIYQEVYSTLRVYLHTCV